MEKATEKVEMVSTEIKIPKDLYDSLAKRAEDVPLFLGNCVRLGSIFLKVAEDENPAKAATVPA